MAVTMRLKDGTIKTICTLNRVPTHIDDNPTTSRLPPLPADITVDRFGELLTYEDMNTPLHVKVIKPKIYYVRHPVVYEITVYDNPSIRSVSLDRNGDVITVVPDLHQVCVTKPPGYQPGDLYVKPIEILDVSLDRFGDTIHDVPNVVEDNTLTLVTPPKVVPKITHIYTVDEPKRIYVRVVSHDRNGEEITAVPDVDQTYYIQSWLVHCSQKDRLEDTAIPEWVAAERRGDTPVVDTPVIKHDTDVSIDTPVVDTPVITPVSYVCQQSGTVTVHDDGKPPETSVVMNPHEPPTREGLADFNTIRQSFYAAVAEVNTSRNGTYQPSLYTAVLDTSVDRFGDVISEIADINDTEHMILVTPASYLNYGRTIARVRKYYPTRPVVHVATDRVGEPILAIPDANIVTQVVSVGYVTTPEPVIAPPEPVIAPPSPRFVIPPEDKLSIPNTPPPAIKPPAMLSSSKLVTPSIPATVAFEAVDTDTPPAVDLNTMVASMTEMFDNPAAALPTQSTYASRFYEALDKGNRPDNHISGAEFARRNIKPKRLSIDLLL